MYGFFMFFMFYSTAYMVTESRRAMTLVVSDHLSQPVGATIRDVTLEPNDCYRCLDPDTKFSHCTHPEKYTCYAAVAELHVDVDTPRTEWIGLVVSDVTLGMFATPLSEECNARIGEVPAYVNVCKFEPTHILDRALCVTAWKPKEAVYLHVQETTAYDVYYAIVSFFLQCLFGYTAGHHAFVMFLVSLKELNTRLSTARSSVPPAYDDAVKGGPNVFGPHSEKQPVHFHAFAPSASMMVTTESRSVSGYESGDPSTKV